MRKTNYLPAIAVLMLAICAVLILPNTTNTVAAQSVTADTCPIVSGDGIAAARERVAIMTEFDAVMPAACLCDAQATSDQAADREQLLTASARIDIEPQLPRLLPSPKVTSAPSIHFSVTSGADTIRAARAENNRLVRDILKTIESDDYDTILSNYSYSCYPTYDKSGDINGYTVTSSLSLNQSPVQLFR